MVIFVGSDIGSASICKRPIRIRKTRFLKYERVPSTNTSIIYSFRNVRLPYIAPCNERKELVTVVKKEHFFT